MARTSGRKWSVAAPEGAVVAAFCPDATSIRAEIEAILESTIRDVRSVRRYRDESYIDDDGVHHARGGIWNDTDGRAADGITQKHVDEALAALRERGLTFAWVDVDAMLAQYQRTGEFPEIALVAPLDDDGQALLNLSPSRKIGTSRGDSFESDGVLFRRHPRGWTAKLEGAIHILLSDPERACTCGVRCEALRALERYLRDAAPMSTRFRKAADEDAFILKRILEIAEQFGFSREAKRHGPRFDATVAAVFVAAKALYGDDFQTVAVRLLQSGLADRIPSIRTLRRYASEPSVTSANCGNPQNCETFIV